MSEDKKKQKPVNQAPANVVQMPSRCPAEDCGKKPDRAGFCNEHFAWFKEGLINRQGEKPKDFDKKYMAYTQKQKKTAA